MAVAHSSTGEVSIPESLKKSIPPALLGYAMGLAVLTVVLVLHRVADIPIGDLTRDPSNSQEFPIYVGVVSNLGILMWCATATLCALSAYLTRASGYELFPWTFFLGAAALTTFLMFDDLLLFHEEFFPRHLHIPEAVTYGTYALCVFGFLIGFRKTILTQTAFPLLLTAGAFLAMGMLADTITNHMEDTSQKFLFEDGFKFLGICGWLAYFAHTSLQVTRELVRPAR